jgi:hypothetical protein
MMRTEADRTEAALYRAVEDALARADADFPAALGALGALADLYEEDGDGRAEALRRAAGERRLPWLVQQGQWEWRVLSEGQTPSPLAWDTHAFLPANLFARLAGDYLPRGRYDRDRKAYLTVKAAYEALVSAAGVTL